VAIDVGEKLEPSIKFVPGTPNPAAGNCLYESCIDNINSRKCFTENLDNTPAFYRWSWNKEGEIKVKYTDKYYPGNYSEEEWKQAWEKLQNTNVYDLDYFGDMAIISCATSLKKDILVINTPWKMHKAFAHDPVSVISANQFDPSNQKSTDVPIVLAYNGNHFESLIPSSEEDVLKTVELVRKYKTGEYKIPRALVNNYKWKIPLNSDKKDTIDHAKSKKARRDSSMQNSHTEKFQNKWETVSRKTKKSQTENTDLSSEKLAEKR